MTTSLRPVSSSERLYCALLWLYPAQFRRTYGREMMLTFRDYYHEEQKHGNTSNSARLWGLSSPTSLLLSALNIGKRQ